MKYVASIGTRSRCRFTMTMHGVLAHLALLVALALSWVFSATAGELLPDLEVCQSKSKPATPRGELLAQAEDLRSSANRFRHYDYDRCYQLGRSCFNEVDSTIMSGVERESYLICRPMEAGDRSNQADWLRNKQTFIGCIIADMEKRAEELDAQAAGYAKGGTVATTLADLAQRSGPLDANSLTLLASGSTWCSRRGGNRVRVLCEDGTGVVADSKGQQVILWQVDPDGRLCFVDFDGSRACYSVNPNDGLFALIAADGGIFDVVSILPRIERSWSVTCSAAD
jgi:hypothetical protein